MTDIALRIENLGKRYKIGRLQKRPDTLRDQIVSMFQRSNWRRPSEDTFWALRDISFEIKQGELVGIIGRNGAGKSTLLKILSRITEPTEGTIDLHGRVASLLEVGTGFHPELTGRENIYLNGAILGMGRREIVRKFDEIVAFAEVEKFIDTPVKHFSSGMYVRLAFAVAAHLEPEILMVDEVLAVGDAAFQKKCLGKMGNVAKEGRTVLFVSHNMAAIEELTTHCLFLESAALKWYGDTRTTIEHYLKSSVLQANETVREWRERDGTGAARVVQLQARSAGNNPKNSFRPGEAIQLLLTVEFQQPLLADVGIVIESAVEKALFSTHLSDSCELQQWSGRREFAVTLSPNYLRQGSYLATFVVFRPDLGAFFDVVYHFPVFDVEGKPENTFLQRDGRWGDLYIPLAWEVRG